MKRKSGYYWAKARDTEMWEITCWNEYLYVWHRYGTLKLYTDNHFIEINETQIPEP